MLVNDLPIYVVSVSGFIERQAFIREQAEKHRLNIEFILKYDSDAIADTDLARCVSGALSRNAMSCVLKHVEAQKMLVSSGLDCCLVLEDDVLLGDAFVEKLVEVLELAETLSGPWLIFLGGMDNTLDGRFFGNKNFQLIKSPLTTAEAYLVNRESCLARINWLSKNLISGPADHFLKELDRQLSISQFRPSTPFVTQGSITGRFKTSLDQSRANKPAWYLNFRFHWNRFSKHYLPSRFARLSSVISLILKRN